MDCYAVLEVSPAASTAAIRASFRRLVHEWHPDKHPDARAEATQRMSEINLAWEILRDVETRRYVDEARETGAEWIPCGVTRDGKRKVRRPDLGTPVMIEADSGCVRRFGHDGGSKLYIEFRTGGLFMYPGVPFTVYGALLRAKWPGRFVIQNIVTGPYLAKQVGA
ncbi:MAG TPA: DnaJ domain-containing protein [Fimbriimonadaceae bacterium]|nr:DnaJ domain-containing protein [Fimbriimonadaceae bacterium]